MEQPGSTPGTGNLDGSPDPVFVLCGARSGSTLMRFVLDAHPEFACPPETNVPQLCAQLATVWSLIEGAPLSSNRGDEPPEIPDAAIAGVRETMDRMVGSYLARRGKTRYCDKSLGTARFAYLVQRIWPEARFICLFRHPMDVIASGMEACPWGVNGYGFDPYIAETPGNMVFALARFWTDTAGTILSAQDQYPQACLRVRYEDLVCDVQAVADQVFGFLGVDRVPDIGKRIFAPERERFGPADYKIWHTSEVTAKSVGRGWVVPAGLIAPQVLTVVNDLCAKLGYLPVDDQWGTTAAPADLRVIPGADAAVQNGDRAVAGAADPRLLAASARSGRVPVPDAASGRVPAATVEAVTSRLTAGLTRAGEEFSRRWEPCAAETFEVTITPSRGAAEHSTGYLVDLNARTIWSPDDDDTGSAAKWGVIAAADTWDQIITGQVNMSVALRRNQVRYCEDGDPDPVMADTRIGLLADLLGLASWGQVRQTVSRASHSD
jgi:Sulfotransferase family